MGDASHGAEFDLFGVALLEVLAGAARVFAALREQHADEIGKLLLIAPGGFANAVQDRLLLDGIRRGLPVGEHYGDYKPVQQPHHAVALTSYWVMTSCARGKANLRPTSSTTLIWQVYSPGARSFSGIWNFTGTASGRVSAELRRFQRADFERLSRRLLIEQAHADFDVAQLGVLRIGTRVVHVEGDEQVLAAAEHLR